MLLIDTFESIGFERYICKQDWKIFVEHIYFVTLPYDDGRKFLFD